MKKQFDYWRDGIYGDPKTHYTHTSQGPKIERMKNLVAYVEEHMPNVHSVCEFGCNNARNLKYMKENMNNISVCGYDICEESLEQAKINCNTSSFFTLDLYNEYDKLSELSENEYDLSFTMGFLMHLPKSYEKRMLIEQMIRVSKNLVIYEPFDGNPSEINSGQSGDPLKKGYYISMQAYEEYGFQRQKVGHRHSNNTRFRFWTLNK